MSKGLAYYQSQMRKIERKMEIKKAKVALRKKREQLMKIKQL